MNLKNKNNYIFCSLQHNIDKKATLIKEDEKIKPHKCETLNINLKFCK